MKGEVFAVKFDPSGKFLASGSFDQTVLLWNTYGSNENYLQLKGHKGAILDLAWSWNAPMLYTASSDATLASWDLEQGERIHKLIGHEDIVNSVATLKHGGEILVSSSDDGSIGLWDSRQKNAIDYYQDGYPVMSACFSEAGNQIFSGGLDNLIKVWDVRQKAVVMTLEGHTDTVTSLALSPNGQTLVSNAMDSTVRLWNIAPFGPPNRQMKLIQGAPHGFDKNLIRVVWSPNGERIMTGSGERNVVIWNADTGEVEYILPGHHGVVNAVDFHPHEPIIASGSTDRMVFLGELL